LVATRARLKAKGAPQLSAPGRLSAAKPKQPPERLREGLRLFLKLKIDA
jgi:hypothetical protein